MPRQLCRGASAALALLLAASGEPSAQDIPPPTLQAAPPAASAEPAAADIPAPTAQAAPPGAAEGRPLQLELFINGASTGFIIGVRQMPDGALVSTARELRGAGLKPPQGSEGDTLVRIDQLPGVTWRYDERAQALHVQAAGAARAPRQLDFGTGETTEGLPVLRSYGGLLNYSLFGTAERTSWQDSNTYYSLSAGLEGRFFTPFGTLSQSAIATATAAPWQVNDVIRLETYWAYSSRDSLITWRAGDTVSGGLAWTRPVRMGGFQMQRNFALRPDLVTMPIPAISGSAAVPSTVDIYSQNTRIFSGQVPAGPFQVVNLPIVTGAGNARVVVRDALGREVVTTLPFYASGFLLKPDFLDFSVEAGLARRSFALKSNDYDERPIGSATLRYGLNDWLTLEGHGEGGAGLMNGGAGAVFSVGTFGIAGGSLAGSRLRGRTGLQYSFFVQAEHERYSFFARTQRTAGTYEDIASATADVPLVFDPLTGLINTFSARPPLVSDQVSLGLPFLGDSSSLNLSYSYLKYEDQPSTRIVSLSYSQQLFGRATLYATGFTDLADRNAYGILAGISVPFGGRNVASAGIQRDRDGYAGFVEGSRSLDLEEGSFGWRVRAAQGKIPDRFAGMGYRARFARLEGGVQQIGKNVRATAEVDGSIALAGGGVFLANRIDDAFAVVDVGAPGVAVTHENRPIGVTDSSGRLLVPYLLSWQRNALQIDPRNLPVDADIRSTRNVVVPADSSGVVVKFGVTQHSDAALVVLVEQDGKPVPVASQGKLEKGGETFVVGYDGQAYISGLSSQNRVVIRRPDNTTCRAEFAYTPKPGQQVLIKDVVCR